LHGEAVAIGMHMAAVLAQQLGRVDQQFVQRQRALLKRLELPTRFEADPHDLWKIMQHDKKVEHGTLRFILPSGLGHVERVAGITEQQVVQAIAAANSD
jgi:3-dehydroquinate synthase